MTFRDIFMNENKFQIKKLNDVINMGKMYIRILIQYEKGKDENVLFDYLKDFDTTGTLNSDSDKKLFLDKYSTKLKEYAKSQTLLNALIKNIRDDIYSIVNQNLPKEVKEWALSIIKTSKDTDLLLHFDGKELFRHVEIKGVKKNDILKSGKEYQLFFYFDGKNHKQNIKFKEDVRVW